ncbi:hypothetical protein N7448_008343 [Penicillium atrosanguineum]|uniref:Uncharacterized protein n=1 Tax=Penicillium atrosanguineum TaxID=1132637 RepID=A0A9W9KZ03_9EURO|nr:hypothetical protein N7448_008343 [Penicillium atrosanguineum]KAJ5330930.1 hypothetical protein N7476_000713 [Penicillium atrosanguineum]
MRFFLPSSWRRGAHLADHDNISIDDDEGELMIGMNIDAARREALDRRRSTAPEPTWKKASWMIAMTMSLKGEKVQGIVTDVPCGIVLWFSFMGGVGVIQ